MLVEFWTRTERIMPAGIKKVEDLYMMDNDRVFMRTVVSLDPNRIWKWAGGYGGKLVG